MIDRNHPDFSSPVQEEIWNAATDLVPLERTLSAIPEEYHRPCTDYYNYVTDLLNNLYDDPETYLAASDVVTYIRWFWVFLYKAFSYEDGVFFIDSDGYKKFVNKMGKPLIGILTERMGMRFTETDGTVRVTNDVYPQMMIAVHDVMAAAYKHYNVNCTDYLTMCDFRALVNYKRTYEDMIVLLNDRGREMAERLCVYAAEHGIKPAKCTYFNRVEFKKKGKIVFILDVVSGKNLKVNIGFAELGGAAFELMREDIDSYDDRDAFAHYLRANLKKCTACNPDCPKRANPVELFGLKTVFCQPFLRMFDPKAEEFAYLCRLISLRDKVVCAGVSEVFYPGNG